MVDNNWMAWCKRDVSDFFGWNFFSFKSAWIFSCAFQLSSTTFPSIFFAWFALCFWEKQRQNIEACTMNTTKQNKSISARKRYRRMFFYLIEKHMQKFRHFWRKKISPEKVTYVPLAPSHSSKASRPSRPGLKVLWGLASKALRPWYERPRARTSPRFFAKIEWPKELQTLHANLFICLENCLALICPRFCCVFQK